MNLLDWIIVLMLIGGLIVGYRKGLIKEVISLIGVLVALFVAYKFSPALAPALEGVLPLPDSVSDNGILQFLSAENAIYTAVAFVVLFLITRLVLSFVANLLTALAGLPVLAQINGLGGALVGFLKALILIFVVVNLLHILPWNQGQEAVTESPLSQGILELTPDFSPENRSTPLDREI